jgi:hypothetical protein
MTDLKALLAGKTGKLALVGAAMAVVLLGAAGQRHLTLSNAREVLMISEAVDPRALLVGHYAILNLTPQSVDVAAAEAKRFKPGQRVYARLTPTAEKGRWTIAALSPTRPASSGEDLIVRAKVTGIYATGEEAAMRETVQLSYGPDRIYLSQEEAVAVEKATRRMWIEPAPAGPKDAPAPPQAQKPVYAILAVTPAGDVWITGVELDGERLEARW